MVANVSNYRIAVTSTIRLLLCILAVSTKLRIYVNIREITIDLTFDAPSYRSNVSLNFIGCAKIFLQRDSVILLLQFFKIRRRLKY